MRGSAPRPGRTLPPGKTRYPFYRRLGGSQGRSGRAENLVLTGIRSRTVPPVVSRYTDWTTRPTFQYLCWGIYVMKYYSLSFAPENCFPPRVYIFFFFWPIIETLTLYLTTFNFAYTHFHVIWGAALSRKNCSRLFPQRPILETPVGPCFIQRSSVVQTLRWTLPRLGSEHELIVLVGV